MPIDIQVNLVGRRHLTREIYQQLRAAILTGQLQPGERLPATRELAQRLAVARTTVTTVYDQLSSEGFTVSHVGRGTFVATDLPLRPNTKAAPSGVLTARTVWDSIPGPGASRRAFEFDFRSGVPDVRSFPFAAWRGMQAREWHRSTFGDGAYGEPAGDPGLRGAIAEHVSISRGVRATGGNVIITNGTQQAVDIVARALVSPGDVVAVEDPGYPQPRRLLQSMGARIAGVPVDHEGLRVEAIPAAARLVLVSPSHQFPLGMAMSLPRRLALLAWAEEHGAAIVEDDYDSEFRLGGRPIEPLHMLDDAGRVIYLGTFSKSMLPRSASASRSCPTRSSARWRPQSSSPTGIRHCRPNMRSRPSSAVARSRVTSGGCEVCIANATSGSSRSCGAISPMSSVWSRPPPASTWPRSRRGERPHRSTGHRSCRILGAAVQATAAFAVDHEPRPGLLFGYGSIATEHIEEGLARLRGASTLDRQIWGSA